MTIVYHEGHMHWRENNCDYHLFTVDWELEQVTRNSRFMLYMIKLNIGYVIFFKNRNEIFLELRL